MQKILNILIIMLTITVLVSCRKQEAYLKDVATYADRPIFINNSILGDKLGTKFNGVPIEVYGSTFLSGTGKFTFYNKNTGAVLLEREFELERNKIDTFYVFQPDSTIAPQLLKNTQANEPGAPEGYMKVKIANLSKIALTNSNGLSYPKLDLIVKAQTVSVLTYLPIDTIVGIGSNLDTAGYYLIKKAYRAGLPQGNYKFSFLDHDTKMPILASGGAVFTPTGTFSAPLPSKPAGMPQPWGRQVYTIYLSDLSRPAANAAYILKNGAYYDIVVNEIFK